MLEFEIDEDGYPTEEAEKNFIKHEFTPEEARLWLLEQWPRIAEEIPCCDLTVSDGEEYGKAAKILEFTTGGWSGAETLIGLITDEFFMSMYYVGWRRGGYYKFIVPIAPIAGLAPPPDNEPRR